MNLHPMTVFALMVLAHLVADYTLQGCLASLKQKKWWQDQMEDVKPERRRKYRNDYKAALVCHSLYWSLIVCLPLAMLNSPVYAIMALVHGALHYVIDDAKANRNMLNLVQDQLLHEFQIFTIWIVWFYMRGGVA